MPNELYRVHLGHVLLLLCALLCAPARASAQYACNPTCSPSKYWVGQGGSYYFDDQGPGGPVALWWRDAASYAVSSWNNVHGSYGRPDLYLYPGNDGLRIVMETPSSPDYTAEFDATNNTLRINPNSPPPYDWFVKMVMLHEFGHVVGFDDLYNCAYQSIMDRNNPDWDFTYNDVCAFNAYYDPVCEAGGGADYYNHCTPLVLSFGGSEPMLSAPSAWFDLRARGRLMNVSWLQHKSDAFLVFDRNDNGMIDDGSELFGSSTPMENFAGIRAWNGFGALSSFDDPALGGNNDGVIDDGDKVYSRLRLWFDDNRDAVSQPAELVTLESAGVIRIPFRARALNYVDEHGNIGWFGGSFTYKRGNTVYEGRIVDMLLVVR